MNEIVISGAALLAIIAFFLRDFFYSIKELKKDVSDVAIRTGLVENNQTHMDDKYEKMYQAMIDLTKEIKNLNIAIEKKKNI